jgi:hypothetical protein
VSKTKAPAPEAQREKIYRTVGFGPRTSVSLRQPKEITTADLGFYKTLRDDQSN